MVARIKATSNNGSVRINYQWFFDFVEAQYYIANLNRTYGSVCTWELA